MSSENNKFFQAIPFASTHNKQPVKPQPVTSEGQTDGPDDVNDVEGEVEKDEAEQEKEIEAEPVDLLKFEVRVLVP